MNTDEIMIDEEGRKWRKVNEKVRVVIPNYSRYGGQNGVKFNEEDEGGDVWEIIDDENNNDTAEFKETDISSNEFENLNETQEAHDTETTIEEDVKNNAITAKGKKKSTKKNFLIFIGLVFVAMTAYAIYNNIPSQPKKDMIETITQYYYYEMFTIPKTEYNAISFPAEWTLESTNDYRIRLRSSGSKLLNSTATASENDIFTLFTNSGYTPSETDGIISQINSIGNIIFFGEYGEDNNLMHIAYFEKL
jgi:hypothetical protein